MKILYQHSERVFDKFTTIATAVLGNSITFIIALLTVIFWLSGKRFFAQDPHECIRDIIHGLIFLSLFIIQKSFNKVIASLHLKVNELVASHETASNAVIMAEQKTEQEINELSKEYAQLAEDATEQDVEKPLKKHNEIAHKI